MSSRQSRTIVHPDVRPVLAGSRPMADPPVRKPTRAPGFDYREPGPYFVTICEHRRISRFGVIVDEDMQPNASGEMILSAWRSLPTTFPTATLDAFVLMPNHFHALIMLSAEDVETNPSLSAIVHWFKTVTTKRYIQGCESMGGDPSMATYGRAVSTIGSCGTSGSWTGFAATSTGIRRCGNETCSMSRDPR